MTYVNKFSYAPKAVDHAAEIAQYQRSQRRWGAAFAAAIFTSLAVSGAVLVAEAVQANTTIVETHAGAGAKAMQGTKTAALLP